MDVLTKFIVAILAISIAAERMVEVLKGWFPDFVLFKAQTDPAKEAQRCAWLHVLAGSFGSLAAVVGKVDVFKDIGAGWAHPDSGLWHWLYWSASCSAAGLLASGGSAFWNHALDLLKASKVKQEQSAKSVVAANNAQSAVANANPTISMADPSKVNI